LTRAAPSSTNDRCGASDLDTGIGSLALAPVGVATLCCGTPEVHLATEGRGIKRGRPLPASAATLCCGAPEMCTNEEADMLVSGPLDPGFKSISRATQGGSSMVPTARLLQIIGRRGGWTIDELIDRSGLDVTEVQHALLLLELDDRIRRRCNEIDPT
jgi:hypothetical protein